MTRCSFCGREYDFYKGATLITNSGNLIHFCSSKCRKNKKLGRDFRNLKWSQHKVEVAGEKERKEEKAKEEKA